MSRSASVVRNQLWAVPGIPGITLLRAAFRNQRFPRHSHDHHVVGLSEGRFRAFLTGSEHEHGPGARVSVIPAGEVHTGECIGDHVWSWRAFYLAPWRLDELHQELTGRAAPALGAGSFADDWLSGRLLAAHRALAETDALRAETLAVEALTLVLARSRPRAGEPFPAPPPRESEAVRCARDYLHAHLAEKITLSTLAGLAGTGPFRLLRAFQREHGVAPHTYLMGLRVERARQLLARGVPIAQAALDTGFADQSHLTRQFKRFVGVTPGEYARGVRAAPTGE